MKIATAMYSNIKAASKNRFCNLFILASVLLPPLLVYCPEHYAGPQPLLFWYFVAIALNHCFHASDKIRIHTFRPVLLSIIIEEYFIK
jgi:hypothetical protein